MNESATIPPIQNLANDEVVFRLAKASKDGKISEAAFILSSKDEKEEQPSLSVWAARLTSPAEAQEFIENRKEDYTLYGFLKVNEVRALRPDPDSPDVPALNVIWHQLFFENGNAKTTPDTRPGSAGHAGITGLLKPSGLANARLYYRSLRSKLADLANQNLGLIISSS